MGNTRSKSRRPRKQSRYQNFYLGLDTFGLGMTLGCIILMFGFVVLQIMEHFMRR